MAYFKAEFVTCSPQHGDQYRPPDPTCVYGRNGTGIARNIRLTSREYPNCGFGFRNASIILYACPAAGRIEMDLSAVSHTILFSRPRFIYPYGSPIDQERSARRAAGTEDEPEIISVVDFAVRLDLEIPSETNGPSKRDGLSGRPDTQVDVAD